MTRLSFFVFNSIVIEIAIYLFLIAAIIPTLYAAITGAPIFSTPKKRAREILGKLGLKPGDRFFELGTGTGVMLSEVTTIKGIKAVGFELSPFAWAITNIRLLILMRKGHQVLLRNFMKEDISSADFIYFFMMPKTIKTVAEYIWNKAKKETIVISYVFAIPDKNPYMTLPQTDKYPPVYFYKV